MRVTGGGRRLGMSQQLTTYTAAGTVACIGVAQIVEAMNGIYLGWQHKADRSSPGNAICFMNLA
jgi:hypothetical protein